MTRTMFTLIIFTSSISLFSQTKMYINKGAYGTDSILVAQIKSITFKTIQPIPTDSLIAYYPLNGNAKDSSGKGNNGTTSTSGVAFVSGRQAMAAQFNSTGYISVADNASFDFSNATGVTIETWIRREQATSGYIIEKEGSSGFDDDEYMINISADGQLQGSFTQNASSHMNILSVSKLGLNTWYNVVLMWNKTTGNISLYVNGILDKTVSSSVTSIQNTTIPLWIGNGYTGTQGFAGSIDEVRIYKRVLTDAEIQALYNGN